MASKLRNYLRVFRKGMGLYQDEIAFLVGSEKGTTVSRYEHNERIPDKIYNAHLSKTEKDVCRPSSGPFLFVLKVKER